MVQITRLSGRNIAAIKGEVGSQLGSKLDAASSGRLFVDRMKMAAADQASIFDIRIVPSDLLTAFTGLLLSPFRDSLIAAVWTAGETTAQMIGERLTDADGMTFEVDDLVWKTSVVIEEGARGGSVLSVRVVLPGLSGDRRAVHEESLHAIRYDIDMKLAVELSRNLFAIKCGGHA